MKNNYIIFIVIIIIIIIYLFNNNEYFRNDIIPKHINNVCIVSFCKDEYDLIDDFINYYSYLFGINNIYIIDNNSTHPYVLSVYEKFKAKGGNLSYCNDYFKQGEETTRIFNLNKHKYDYLFGIDFDEFLCLKTSNDCSNIEELKNYFNNLPNHIEKFNIPSYYSLVDNKNENYIDNKITFPAKYITYFDSIPITNKNFYRSNTFISTSMGSHKGNTINNTINNTEDMRNIIYFHYQNTGSKRNYERAYNNCTSFNYINDNDSLKDKILRIPKDNVPGFHRVHTVLKYLIKEYIIIEYIKYFNRLPSIEELNEFDNINDIDNKFKNLEIQNENTDNFNYYDLLYHDNDLDKNNCIYDDRISKCLSKIDKII